MGKVDSVIEVETISSPSESQGKGGAVSTIFKGEEESIGNAEAKGLEWKHVYQEEFQEIRKWMWESPRFFFNATLWIVTAQCLANESITCWIVCESCASCLLPIPSVAYPVKTCPDHYVQYPTGQDSALCPSIYVGYSN